MSCLLTVVTVTYQDIPGLERTLGSLAGLLHEAGTEAEVIVVDGGTEGVEDTVKSAEMPCARVIPGPDDGVYDAMNKGLRASRGRFVWFLNGGDLCVESNWPSFRVGLPSADNCGLLFGYVKAGHRRSIYRSPRSIEYLNHALPTSHQAIIYPGDRARALQYDLSYTVAGDYAFTARLYRSGVRLWRRVDRPLVRFELGGLSSRRAHQVALDATRAQREILELPWWVVAASRLRHAVSRVGVRLMVS